MNAAVEILVRLRKAFYPDREWAFLPQVANGTGGGYGRTADAIALNCWPSRGMELHGFEVKTLRSDFKREMAKPEKAEAIAQYCDRWFIVTPSAAIVKPEELPPTWGLIVVDDKPGIVVAAPKLDPKPFTRGFVAAVLRAAQKEGGIPLSEHQAAMNRHWAEAYKAGARSAMDFRTRDRIKWQVDALVNLEKYAANTLKAIRHELEEVRRIETDPPVDVPDDVASEATHG